MKTEEIKLTLNEEKENIRLTGWIFRPQGFWPQAEKRLSPMLILCHGVPRARPSPSPENQESESSDGGYAALAERCCLNLGVPVFHFNFRGTGESGGNFDLSGWIRDLEAVLQFWQKKEPGLEFILWGFSGGAAVSACVAAKHPRVKGVILAACPATFEPVFPPEKRDEIIAWFRQVGIIKDPWFPTDPQKWLEGIYAVKPADMVARISPVPLLILHGTGDELIPVDQAEWLFEKAGEPKTKALLPGAGHQLRIYPEAVQAALDWLGVVLKDA